MKLIKIMRLFLNTHQVTISPKELAKQAKKSLIEVLTILDANALPATCFDKRGRIIILNVFDHLMDCHRRSIYNAHDKWYRVAGNVICPLNEKLATELDFLKAPVFTSYVDSQISIADSKANIAEVEKLGWKLWKGIDIVNPGFDALEVYWKE